MTASYEADAGGSSAFPAPPPIGASLAGARAKPGRIAGIRVGGDDLRTPRAAAHNRNGCRTDTDALEQIQMHPERSGEDRLDDVTVTHRHPPGASTVQRFELSIVTPNGATDRESPWV